MKPKNKYYGDYSNYSGVVVIYLVSAAVAATMIFPGEEHWYICAVKALIWPLYLISKVL
jgi:hypothetical protein